jgi:hypothetical protein
LYGLLFFFAPWCIHRTNAGEACRERGFEKSGTLLKDQEIPSIVPVHQDGNLLLAAISREDAAAIRADSVRVTLRSGDDTFDAVGETCLWLPESAVLSFGELCNDRHVECGMVGREGAIGWAPLVGLAQDGERICALTAGTALALPQRRLAALAAARPVIAATLLRYREALMVQMRWTIAARLQYGPEARLARWLCMLHDRVHGDTLDITHLRLAAFLNARRASITDSLHLLEGDRIVRCTRGRIVVRDRNGLEAVAGPAYGAAEQLYTRLIAPPSRPGIACAAR